RRRTRRRFRDRRRARRRQARAAQPRQPHSVQPPPVRRRLRPDGASAWSRGPDGSRAGRPRFDGLRRADSRGAVLRGRRLGRHHVAVQARRRARDVPEVPVRPVGQGLRGGNGRDPERRPRARSSASLHLSRPLDLSARYARVMRASDRLLLLLAPAAALATVDLFVKATVPTASWAFHHRSDGWIALSVALLVGTAFLCVVPSSSVALAGGVMSAGVLGNLVSARADGNWVPNPLTFSHGTFTVAYNLADV